MKKFQAICLIISGLLFFSIPAQALTVVTASPGDTQYIQSVSEVAAGPDMNGMVITVSGLNEGGVPFTNQIGTWVTPVFQETPPFSYAFPGAVFSGDQYLFYLLQAGDTFNNSWLLYSFYDVTLTNIIIDALPGNVVFDRTIDGMEKTIGSGQGKDFSTSSTSISFPDLGTYMNLVALDGQAPQGDLYSTLDIQLGNGFGRLFSDSVYYELFTADTDRIVPVPTPVSSSLMLLGSGLLGLAGLGRKYFS
ncbi:MAG: hypothetical protein ACOZFS_16455 [Thermodesulfobacteriota bacterium]